MQRDARSMFTTGKSSYTWHECHLAHIYSRSRSSESTCEKKRRAYCGSQGLPGLILFFMLFIAIVPTGSDTYYNIISGSFDTEYGRGEFYNRYYACGVPSACFWNRRCWKGWRWDAGLAYFLLISSYVARAAALFEASETFFRRNMRDRLLGKLEETLDRKVKHIRDRVAHRGRASWAQKLGYHTYLATYAVTLACSDLYSSFLAPLLWVFLNLVWGFFATAHSSHGANKVQCDCRKEYFRIRSDHTIDATSTAARRGI